MKIYGSTTYVDPQENNEWYQLSVISQWDWKSTAVCYQWLKSFGNPVLISYKLQKHTAVSSVRTKVEDVETLTKEMEDCLREQGYLITNSGKRNDK